MFHIRNCLTDVYKIPSRDTHQTDDVAVGEVNCIMRSFMICAENQMLLRWSKKRELDG